MGGNITCYLFLQKNILLLSVVNARPVNKGSEFDNEQDKHSCEILFCNTFFRLFRKYGWKIIMYGGEEYFTIFTNSMKNQGIGDTLYRRFLCRLPA